MRASTLIALGLATALQLSGARGTEPARVRIIDAGSAELARKLQAEVLYAGFAAHLGDADAADPHQSAQAPSLRVVSDHLVELTLRGPRELASSVQTLARGPGESDSFALRVVEHLRARLVDLGWTLPAAEGSIESKAETLSTKPAPPVPAQAQHPSPVEPRDAASETDVGAPRSPLTLWLAAGAAGSWAPGGLGVVPHGTLGVRLDLAERWGVSVSSLWPLVESEVEAEEGEASVAWHQLGVGIDYSLSLSAPAFASAGVGASLLVLDVQGEGREPFEGRDDRLLAGAYHAELCAGIALSKSLRLRATLLAGVNDPRPVLRFDERDVASLGRWFGSAGITLDVGLPLSREAGR